MKNFNIFAGLSPLFWNQTLHKWKTPFFKAGFMMGVVYLFHNIWKNTDISYSRSSLMTYLVFCESILLSIPSIHRQIAEAIAHDEISVWFSDPVHYVLVLRYQAFISFIYGFFALFSLGMTFAFLLNSEVLLSMNAHLIINLFLALFSGWLFITLYSLIGLSSAWIGQQPTLVLVTQKFSLILGGALAPLSFYPAKIELLFSLTPFGAALYNIGFSILSADIGMTYRKLLIVLYVIIFEMFIYFMSEKVRTHEGAH